MVFVLYYKNDRKKALDKVNVKRKKDAIQYFARKKRETIRECLAKYDIVINRPPNPIEKRRLFKEAKKEDRIQFVDTKVDTKRIQRPKRKPTSLGGKLVRRRSSY
tara:strand:- start:596 stop:910 length:315 start_codon:yes stop_codon:yes gene_type:complete